MPDVASEIGFIRLVQPHWLPVTPKWTRFGGSGQDLRIHIMQMQFPNSSSSSRINSQRGCWGSAGLSSASLASSLFFHPQIGDE